MLTKSDYLLIGIGEAGGRLVGEMLKKDKRYIGLFINTSYKDILQIENAKNVYVIPNADGTGRQRGVAQGLLKEYGNSIIDQIDRFPLQKVITIFFSFGGGSGSGISPTLIRLLGKVRPNKMINIVGILPSIEESKRAKENAISCWNEIVTTPNINLSFILDNNKRENKYDINKEFANYFDALMDISKLNTTGLGVIDSADAEILTTAKGSGAIYILPKDEKDTKIAIAKATSNSIFADFSHDTCSFLGVSLLPESQYKRNLISNHFSPREDKFIEGFNDKYNLVVITGCDMALQKGAIEYLDLSISESVLQEGEESQTKVDDLVVGQKKKPNVVAEPSLHQMNIKEQEKDVDKLLEDDNLWDDIMNM